MRFEPAVAILCCLTAPAAAQTDRADAFITAEMARQRIPGLSLAVLRNGTIIKAAGYGLADVAAHTPATSETIYKLASASKQFIATGIMLLAQDGKLSVDDPVAAYLPGTPASWREITIRQLLTHTAGLVREAPGFDPAKNQPDADVIRTSFALPLVAPPGTKWQYSNLGYFVLAEVIRTVSGRPWSEFLDERVFQPLGMRSTRTTTKGRVANQAQGYVDNDAWKRAPEWAAIRPSGAFVTTVLDLAKWDAALYTDDVLRESSRREMWTPVRLTDGTSYPYGFGWMTGTLKGHRFVHHPGGMPGARADIVRFVDQGLTIIVLMNLDDVDIDAVVNGLAAVYLP